MFIDFIWAKRFNICAKGTIMRTILSVIITLFITQLVYAQDIDFELKKRIDMLGFKKLNITKDKDLNLYNLGKELFFSNEVSGNRNINCSTCHHPDAFSADLLPLPIGVGANGIATKRIQNSKNQIVPRNSPALYNLGHGVNKMFWDARVSYDIFDEVYTTPEPSLNGYNPSSNHITKHLTGALSAQALFPPLSHLEMRGKKGSNEIADAKTNIEAWSLIMKRLLGISKIKEGFLKAFNGQKDFNIGHFGAAVAEFEKHRFVADDTNWDRYLEGDLKALNAQEKRGAKVFMGHGRCFVCHSGSHLSSFKLENIAAPQLGPGKDIHQNDEGRFLITKRARDLYKFRVPPLRNVALTSPYFHSGAYLTLEEVVNHYEGGVNSIDKYDSTEIDITFRKNYSKDLFVETNPYRIFRKKENAHPMLRARSIRLSEQEKKDLIYFLKYSLTQNKLKKYLK